MKLFFTLSHFTSLRVDGIEKAPGLQETEFLTPYSTRGIMVPKYTLLLQLVSNIPGSVEFEKFLSPLEVCLLHRMLSSTVEPYQRGDERTSCPGTISDSGRNPQAPWITQNKLVEAVSREAKFHRINPFLDPNSTKQVAQPSTGQSPGAPWKVVSIAALLLAPLYRE